MEITDQHEAKDIFGCIDEPGDFVSGLAGETTIYYGGVSVADNMP